MHFVRGICTTTMDRNPTSSSYALRSFDNEELIEYKVSNMSFKHNFLEKFYISTLDTHIAALAIDRRIGKVVPGLAPWH